MNTKQTAKKDSEMRLKPLQIASKWTLTFKLFCEAAVSEVKNFHTQSNDLFSY